MEEFGLPKPTLPREGGCACGAVRYRALISAEAGACHCGMCRRWTGGVNISVTAADVEVTQGADRVGLWTSSPWAERGFCRECGGSLFYRVTEDGPHKGEMHLSAGTLDDVSGLALTTELYVEVQPGYYRFAQETRRLTEAELMALLGVPTPQGPG